MVGYEITKRYGEEGLPDDTIIRHDVPWCGRPVHRAFIPRGETIRVYGEVERLRGQGTFRRTHGRASGGGITFDPA